MIRRPKDVCPKDCKNRTFGCHSNCEKYLGFYKDCREHLEEKKNDFIVAEYIHSSVTKNMRRK